MNDKVSNYIAMFRSEEFIYPDEVASSLSLPKDEVNRWIDQALARGEIEAYSVPTVAGRKYENASIQGVCKDTLKFEVEDPICLRVVDPNHLYIVTAYKKSPV